MRVVYTSCWVLSSQVLVLTRLLHNVVCRRPLKTCYGSMPKQIEVWAVSNLTFVLLSFAIIYTLNDRSSVQTLALYSCRSVTLKRVNGDATSAVCRLRKYVSQALHAFPNCLWIYDMLVHNAMKQKLLLNQIHVVEVCEAGWYKTFVRLKIYSAMWYYL